jgi:quercetin dioxygenase-like cupin family protein
MLTARIGLVALAALASACVSLSIEESAPPTEATLAAIQGARVRECPAERTQANARNSSDGATSGAVIEDIAFTPLASDATRTLRLRRIIVAPGGVIAWHNHEALQGMALLAAGEMTEFRNTCLDPIVYRAGDIAREDAGTAHGWRNESDAEAVILVAHVVAR